MNTKYNISYIRNEYEMRTKYVRNSLETDMELLEASKHLFKLIVKTKKIKNPI